MREFSGDSSVAASERQDGRTAMRIEGFSCFLCGTWIEAEFKVVRDIPLADIQQENRKGKYAGAAGMTSKEYSSVVRKTIENKYDEICILQESMQLNKIAPLFNMAYATLLKYFKIICAERGRPTRIKKQVGAYERKEIANAKQRIRRKIKRLAAA
jgi:hypothetical protein